MKIDGALIFLAGAGVGSVVTYFIVRKKFDELNAKEVAELKIMYGARNEENHTDDGYKFEDKMKEAMDKVETQEELAKKAVNKKDIVDYSKITKEYKKEGEKVNIDDEIELYPEDFGEDNDVVYCTYYSDGYLVDDDDHIVDIDMIGGKETLKHIGEGSDPELLQVRNNTYEMDYEIVFDEDAYSDVAGKELPDISEEE